MNEYDSELAHPGNGINTSKTTYSGPIWQFAIDRFEPISAGRTPRYSGFILQESMAEKTNATIIEPICFCEPRSCPKVRTHFDGYRGLAIKAAGAVILPSRNDNDFNARYLPIGKALRPMPDDTVIDGKAVALDPEAKAIVQPRQHSGELCQMCQYPAALGYRYHPHSSTS